MVPGEKSRLTNKEYEIMKILWESDTPMLISDIIGKADKIAVNSLHPMIKKLIKNGFIKVTGNVKVSKTKSRLYASAITVDEYAAMCMDEISRTANKKLNWNNILSFFIKRNKKDDSIIPELEEFIKSYYKKNGTNRG